MRYRLFGRSGLRVSEICLGTMTFGEAWGWGASRAESRRIFDAFVERGGNFIDTANRYTNGESEEIVGDCIASERHRFVVATKYTLTTNPEDPNASGNHRKCLVQSLEGSLRRLRTDYIDVYWVHAWDEWTPIEETMRALDDLVRAGKVLYVGISDAPAWVVAQGNTLAELRGWTPFVGLQIEYSLLQRTPERELLPMATAFGLAVTAWGPIGGGVLTGKYAMRNGTVEIRDSLRGEATDWRLTPRNLAIADAVRSIAGDVGCTPAQLALAWLRGRPGLIIPIVGARSLEQIEENLATLGVEVPAAALARLDEASAIELGFPLEFLARDVIEGLVYGGWRDRVESHRPALRARPQEVTS